MHSSVCIADYVQSSMYSTILWLVQYSMSEHVQYSMYSVQMYGIVRAVKACTVCILWYVQYSMHSIVCTVQHVWCNTCCVVYVVQHVQYNMHNIACTLQQVQYSIYSAVCAVQNAQYSLCRYSTCSVLCIVKHSQYSAINIVMHGFHMILVSVMPGLVGGSGNYFVPMFQGSLEVVYSQSHYVSTLARLRSYLFLILSSLLDFGAGTGWTLYPPYRFLVCLYPIQGQISYVWTITIFWYCFTS